MNPVFHKLIHGRNKPIADAELKTLGMSDFEMKQFREGFKIINEPKKGGYQQ